MQEQKVALVTGSSRGIGANLVQNFARKGYRVAITCHQSEGQAKKLLTELEEAHAPGIGLVCRADVTKRSEMRQMFDRAYGQFGRVDVLVNTAGLNIDRPFVQMTDEEWSTVIGTILTGTFICSQEFAMRYTGDQGHIINIGALTAIRGRKNGVNYCSARAGVLVMTKCLALELAPRIRVNSVTPGWINTDEVINRYNLREPENLARTLGTVPMGRLGTPGDVFDAIDFLIHHSSYITGQNLLVDGGMLMV